MTYSATTVANNVLQRSFEERRYMSPMKLQKILYFVASEYQKRTGQPLFSEQFLTWDYGPVLRSVYDEFRPFSRKDIKKYATNAAGKAFVISESHDTDLAQALTLVWVATRDRSAVFLSELTHMENSAWDKAFQHDEPVLDWNDVENDDTYRENLGITS